MYHLNAFWCYWWEFPNFSITSSNAHGDVTNIANKVTWTILPTSTALLPKLSAQVWAFGINILLYNILTFSWYYASIYPSHIKQSKKKKKRLSTTKASLLEFPNQVANFYHIASQKYAIQLARQERDKEPTLPLVKIKDWSKSPSFSYCSNTICSPASSCFWNPEGKISNNRNRSHVYQEGRPGNLANPAVEPHYKGKRTVSFCLSVQQKWKRQEQEKKHHPLLKILGKRWRWVFIYSVSAVSSRW